MERINIEEKNIEFKQIVSGPAPVGRILNYIKLTGKGLLKHVNGNRNTTLSNNIGSAWTTEFMIGLELIALGEEIDVGKYYLKLTESGEEIFNIIKDLDIEFDDGSSIKKVKKQVNDNCPQLFKVFEKAFRKSVVFRILKLYLEENGYEYIKSSFLDQYFTDLKSMYDEPEAKEWTKAVRSTSVTTGGNRVPSLTQICEFFEYAIVKNPKIFFIKEQFDKVDLENAKIKYDEETLKKEVKKEEKIIKEIKNLEEKYGIDGNVAINAVVRNSTVQKMFKDNLIAENGSKCMICGITIDELLIASHIKPASECNVHEKIDNNNGLLLCSNHDKLFDRHLITFDCFSGEMLVSDKLSAEDKAKLGIDQPFSLDAEIMTEKRVEFLAVHNVEFHNQN